MKRLFLILSLSVVLSGCVKDAETGESEFNVIDWVKQTSCSVAEAASKVDDGVKADALEGLGFLLAALGLGAGTTPMCQAAAAYYRRRKEQKALSSGKANTDPQQNESVIDDLLDTEGK